MPWVQQILVALRTLTEDEPRPPRRKHAENRTPQRTSSKRKQAVALVITFRDLFTSGGLNFLLEDGSVSQNSSMTDKPNTSYCQKDTKCTSMIQSSQMNGIVSLPQEGSSTSANLITEPWHLNPEETVSLLQEERLISSPGLVLPTCTALDSFPVSMLPTISESNELEVFGRGRRNKKRKAVTVPLTPDDENKTVATLREVLKWSPRKQSLATFALPFPKEGEHKAVAVVQNAVNRVKEEQQQKKKRKLRLFKLTFC